MKIDRCVSVCINFVFSTVREPFYAPMKENKYHGSETKLFSLIMPFITRFLSVAC